MRPNFQLPVSKSSQGSLDDKRGPGYRECIRLQKCTLVHYIDMDYTRKSLDPPKPRTLDTELHTNVADLKILRRGAKRMRSRRIQEVQQLMESMVNTDCGAGTKPDDLYRDPIVCLKAGQLSYAEWVAGRVTSTTSPKRQPGGSTLSLIELRESVAPVINQPGKNDERPPQRSYALTIRYVSEARNLKNTQESTNLRFMEDNSNLTSRHTFAPTS